MTRSVVVPVRKLVRVRGPGISTSELAEVRRRAFRRRIWFRVLDRAERAIVSLTIRCVERIRSPRLAEIVTAIVRKLRDVLKSRVERLMDKVGRSLAQKISRVAQIWGNVSAKGWAEDSGFVRYLAMTYMNTLETPQKHNCLK